LKLKALPEPGRAAKSPAGGIRALDNKFSLLKAQKIYYKALKRKANLAVACDRFVTTFSPKPSKMIQSNISRKYWSRPQEFCSIHKVDLDKIDFDSRYGQQLRRELLLHLKDRGGLKYREIARLSDFAGVKMNSLGSLYRYEKSKKS